MNLWFVRMKSREEAAVNLERARANWKTVQCLPKQLNSHDPNWNPLNRHRTWNLPLLKLLTSLCTVRELDNQFLYQYIILTHSLFT